MGRGSRVVAFAMVAALVAGACTGGGRPTPAPLPSGSPIPRGGTLRVGLLQWNRDAPYDPTNFFDFSWFVMYPCCLLRTLYYYNGRPAAERGGIVRPDLATGLPEVSADGLTWTMHIRTGLHYAPPLQDVEITAPDFIRAIERMLSPTPPQFPFPGFLGFGANYFLAVRGAQDYADGKAETIAGLEAPDPHTLRAHLTGPNGDFAYRLSFSSTAPIPPNPFHPEDRFGVAEGHTIDGYGRFLVSSGPYMFEGSEKIDFSKPPGQQQAPSGLDQPVLVRNPSWRRSSDPLRPAYADRIEFVAFDTKPYGRDKGFGQDESEEYRLAFAKKVDAAEIDVVGDWQAPLEQARRYQADPSLKARVGVFEYHTLRFLNLNLALPPFDDIHVRRAVNHVIDKKKILEVWQRGLDAAAIFDHLAPDATEDNLLTNYHPYPSPDHGGDLAAAQEQMKLSTNDRDHDGTCDRPACDLGTVLWRDDGANPDVAEVVKEDLARIGITFVPKFVRSFDMYAACSDPAAHATLCQNAWVADYPSATTFFPPLYSSDSFGASNYSLVGATLRQLRRWHYPVTSVPTVDQRMKSCQETAGIAQIQCWVALDQYLMEEVVPAVPLLIDAAPWTFSSRVAAFSWDQAAGVPALDKIALKPGS